MKMRERLVHGALAASLATLGAGGCSDSVVSDGVDSPPAASPFDGLPYAVVDTEQRACFGNAAQADCPNAGESFYGQDGQIEGNRPAYTVSADGWTVHDDVTDLTWQQSPDLDGDGIITVNDKLTWEQAQARPAELNAARFGGFDDWRLPSIKELYSLILFSGDDPSGYQGTDTSPLVPFIDTEAFTFDYGDSAGGERLIDSQYASSSRYVSTTGVNGDDTLFGVNFADGRIKGYGLAMPGGRVKTFTVLCVRGNTSYGLNDLVDNGDGTVTDHATSLMWTDDDNGEGVSWEEALRWVEEKNAQSHLGYGDWRLPNAKELQSIVDYTRSPDTTSSAAIAPVFNVSSFENEEGETDAPWYWASTTHATYNGMGGGAVYVAFGRAGGWQEQSPGAGCYTLADVHGAGAQRSDPKTEAGLATIGTACSGATAYGLGPQGDAQRAANYVRLVRDAS